MGLLELSLQFDNPSRSYFPGTAVSGRVIVACNANYKSQGLTIRLAGSERVAWTESHYESHYNSSTKETEGETVYYHYSGNETLLENEIRLAGDGSTTFTFLPGRYQYPFRFILPPVLPSDFSGGYGSISYEVQTIIKRSWWKFNDKTAAQIHVIPMYDLNENPDARTPGQATDSKMVCCLCCKSGPITATLKIPHKGYIPGEFIDAEVDVQNLSTRDVDGIILSLCQEYNFKSTSAWSQGNSQYGAYPKTKTVGNAIATAERGGVAPGASDVWNGQLLRVPSVRPTTRGSHIINVWYCLRLEVKFLLEWRQIQTEMTQLTRRAAQIKVTLSAYLLSAPELPTVKQNDHDDFNVNKAEVKQEFFLLQHVVDGIRNELRRKYLVSVLLEKVEIPPRPEGDALLGTSDYDEPLDDVISCHDNYSDPEYLPNEYQIDDDDEGIPEKTFGRRTKTLEKVNSDDSDPEYSPNEYQVDDDDEERPEQALGKRIKRMEKVNSDHSSVDCPKEVNINAAESSLTNKRPRKRRKRKKKSKFIPDGPNRFKNNGWTFQWKEEEQSYICDKCGFKSGPKIRSMGAHLRMHNSSREKFEERQVVIPDGPNTFKYNGYSLKLNDEDKCYSCGVCDFKGTNNVHSILSHIRGAHYTAEDKRKFTAIQISNNEWVYGEKYKISLAGEKYQCELCKSRIFGLTNICKHIRNKHIAYDECPTDPLTVPEEPFVNNDTTPIQAEYQSVAYTFDPAENKYSCSLCSSKVSSRNTMHSHIKTQHTAPPQKVVCDICGVELSSERYYKKHLQRHQMNPVNCPICDKKFFCERNYKMHMRVHEVGDELKKHQCEYCGKKFVHLQHHTAHLRIHTGETPFECQICGQKFRYSSVLSQHRKTVHGIQLQSHKLLKVNL